MIYFSGPRNVQSFGIYWSDSAHSHHRVSKLQGKTVFIYWSSFCRLYPWRDWCLWSKVHSVTILFVFSYTFKIWISFFWKGRGRSAETIDQPNRIISMCHMYKNGPEGPLPLPASRPSKPSWHKFFHFLNFGLYVCILSLCPLLDNVLCNLLESLDF